MSPRFLLSLVLATGAWSLAAADLASSPVSVDVLRAHLAFLADDLLEGRGMGQRGGDLAVAYLESQMRALGLQPANGTSYLQPVRMSGIAPRPEASRLSLTTARGPVDLRLNRDLHFIPLSPRPETALDAPLIFVGHGVGQGHRDDYKGVDVRGKVLVMLMGERSDSNLEAPCCTPDHYYGRWTYKFEEGIRRGAAAVLIVHTTPSASYDWNVAALGYRTERFVLENDSGTRILGGLITEEGARKLFAAAKMDLATMQKNAESKDFRPVEMGIRAKGTIANRIRSLVQYNVAGLVPGTDPLLKDECVIYAAHWDHFGRRADGRILNGAVDNASGCAATLAIAQAACLRPAKRSQLFLFLTGEETGMLGAIAYVRKPLVPLDRTAAALNLESLNFLGRTRDIAALGIETSELWDHAREVARDQGLRFRESRNDKPGLYFRADHFAFVRGGVPAVSPGFSLDGGWDYVDDPKGSQARAEAYLADGYHQPTDRYDPAWKLDGMLQQTQFIFELGQRVGNAPRKPAWRKSTPAFGQP